MSQIHCPNATGLTTLALFFWDLASVKRVPGETFESPSGNPAAVFICLKAPTSRGALTGDMGVNATSVLKKEFCGRFFLKARSML
ncbi:hypothetical protein [Pseudomonas frederiksbergensis]|uniref:hypothetical protein n=1 Tax=Pseudomonas frederiksbergensis TaxID=104087 RepID=UPI00161A1E24|nr:hypothetical protein [Pseudomonas frederiksbergensis]